MSEEKDAKKIINFWFGKLNENGLPDEDKQKMWWAKDKKTDQLIANNFETDLKSAIIGELESWKRSPHGLLAFVVLTDQFSRNIYRNSKQSFSQDKMALTAVLEGIDSGLDTKLVPVEKAFLYMPFMHSEDIDIQEKSVHYFSALEKEHSGTTGIGKILKGNKIFADRHYEIIKRFGRFPHRNSIVGRESTPEETEFLKQPGSSF